MKTSEKTSMSVKHQAASAEVHANLERVKSEENPILQQFLKTSSTFTKIRRTFAYVRRFVRNARKKDAKTGPITVQELKESENQLFRWSQLHLDPSAIDKKLIPKPDGDGLLRAHGRLEDARMLPQELRNPIILPRNHLLVELLLRHLHDKRGHCGYKSLMYESTG